MEGRSSNLWALVSVQNTFLRDDDGNYIRIWHPGVTPDGARAKFGWAVIFLDNFVMRCGDHTTGVVSHLLMYCIYYNLNRHFKHFKPEWIRCETLVSSFPLYMKKLERDISRGRMNQHFVDGVVVCPRGTARKSHYSTAWLNTMYSNIIIYVVESTGLKW